jgi:hypothetical protein
MHTKRNNGGRWEILSIMGDEEGVPLDPAFVVLSTFIRQCGQQFGSSVYELCDGGNDLWYVYTEAGDVCIADKHPKGPEPSMDFDETVTIKADGTDSERAELQDLSKELWKITEQTMELTIHHPEFKWGLNKGQFPFLIDCGSSTCTTSSDFSLYLQQIALAVASEISLVPEMGKCISHKNTPCVGPNVSVSRMKVASYRVRRMFKGQADEALVNQLVRHTLRRICELEPEWEFASVACCEKCMKLYAGTTKRRPNTRAARMRREVKKEKSKGRFKEYDYFPLSPAKKRKGMLMVQRTAAKSHQRAYWIYMARPLPPYQPATWVG